MKKTERQYYQNLYEVAAIINSAHTSENVLQAITESVSNAMGAKACSIMLLTPDRKQLIRKASFGLSEKYVNKGPLLADRSISEALGGKVAAIVDAAQDERVQYRQAARNEKISSILCVPVKLRNDIIGVMRVYTDEPFFFNDSDIQFVTTVANLGAIALENAKLYESIERDFEELKRQWFPFL